MASRVIGVRLSMSDLSYPQDRPLRLAVAAKVAFPDGSMSASGLRREAQRDVSL